MTDQLSDLIRDLENAPRLPKQALRAAVAHAQALKPRIEALARRQAGGEWAYPSEDNLLFYGLFVLAAAREQAFWPAWVELVQQDDELLGGIFGDFTVLAVATITLGLVGDRMSELVGLVLDRDTSDEARSGLSHALTRLTCEGRLPRTEFVAVIDDLVLLGDQDGHGDALWCAEQAIVEGGIAEREGTLAQIWSTPEFKTWREVDKADSLERLATAAANPGDLTRFDEDSIWSPEDPVLALRWLERLEKSRKDPAEGIALSWREREWLASFLNDAAKTEKTMSFEELDGFFHALVIGPDLVLPSEYLRVVWGSGPVFDNETQVQQVMDLLQRHWNSIARRAAQDAEPAIWLHASGGLPPGLIPTCMGNHG